MKWKIFSAALLLVIALLAVSVFLAPAKYNIIRVIFYPGHTSSEEIHSLEGETVSFSVWDDALQKYVKNGHVSYSEWQKDDGELRQTLALLAKVDLDELGRNHLLATYINAYNAFTIALMLEYWPLQSINDIMPEKRWLDERWQIGKQTMSLDKIEHAILRREFIEPRIHFAVVCASKGCPHLSSKAFSGAIIDQQLTTAAQDFFARRGNLRIEGDTVYLSSILDWFLHDFINPQLATEKKWFPPEFANASENTRLLLFVAKYAPPQSAMKIRENPERWSISFTDYDWGVNGD